ncbi:type 2 DNA topoisomerase 6 subunit B-like [Impatiens glandulifera]|uniref:type 2 DNA topoisomerase 6 subunit B-like n=1 Tax=Impatiens glandulifera TaxID=253017 RepID=UPI001FB12AF0|nr:type 2 DNA topoisomerase 6 subunit B-like [Impatiens glandulifera]
MEVSSVQKLCEYLISCATQRCRMTQHYCRLAVVVVVLKYDRHPSLRISVSDTGIGSSLEEFNCLKYTTLTYPASTENWDGMMSLTTTRINDNEIYHYSLNLNETSSTRLTKLPSNSKNGTNFSGTEVTFFTSGIALKELKCFINKILVLKIQNIAIELVVDNGGPSRSHCEQILKANECAASSESNIERLISGFEDYVLKHGNILDDKCVSCSSSGCPLKVGSGTVCTPEHKKNTGMVLEAVVIISEILEATTSQCCCTGYDTRTEVLYFEDFSPSEITQGSLNALSIINWAAYGLKLKGITEKDGYGLMEWDNLAPNVHIGIVLHYYHEGEIMMPSDMKKARAGKSITGKAVKLALTDLKQKNSGVLLSTRAKKICSTYAPDLARTVAGLVVSSCDTKFQEECLSVLGLKIDQVEKAEDVENRIKAMIVSVIERNDTTNPKRGSREAASYLFEENCSLEPADFLDEEYCQEEEEE